MEPRLRLLCFAAAAALAAISPAVLRRRGAAVAGAAPGGGARPPEWCTAQLLRDGPFLIPLGRGGGSGYKKPSISNALWLARRLRRAALLPLITPTAEMLKGLDGGGLPDFLPLGHAYDAAEWCAAGRRAGHCIACRSLPRPGGGAEGPSTTAEDAAVGRAVLAAAAAQRNCSLSVDGSFNNSIPHPTSQYGTLKQRRARARQRRAAANATLCPVVLQHGIAPLMESAELAAELRAFRPAPRLAAALAPAPALALAVHMRIEPDWRAFKGGALWADAGAIARVAAQLLGALGGGAVFVASHRTKHAEAAAALRAASPAASVAFRRTLVRPPGSDAEWTYAQQSVADEHFSVAAERFLGCAHSTFTQSIVLSRSAAGRPSWVYHAAGAAAIGYWPLWAQRGQPHPDKGDSCPDRPLRVHFGGTPCEGQRRGSKGQRVARGCADGFRIQLCGERDADFERRAGLRDGALAPGPAAAR